MKRWRYIGGKWRFTKRVARQYTPKHPQRKELFDLGLAISGATLQPGETRSQNDIACFVEAAGAHCSRQRIQQIEERALRKLRHLERITKLQ